MNIVRARNGAVLNGVRALLVRSAVVLGLLCAAIGLAPGPAALAHDATYGQPSGGLVTMVELDRSGGLLGASDHFAVSAGDPHPQAPWLMRVAGGREFRSLRDKYLDDNPCCDRYQYVITVHYRDHVTKTVTALEGAPGTPPVLREVIDLTVQIGQGHS